MGGDGRMSKVALRDTPPDTRYNTTYPNDRAFSAFLTLLVWLPVDEEDEEEEEEEEEDDGLGGLRQSQRRK